jgi:hypothetical protein
MEKEAIFQSEVVTSNDFALILWAAKHRMPNARSMKSPAVIKTVTSTHLPLSKLREDLRHWRMRTRPIAANNFLDQPRSVTGFRMQPR